MSSGCKAGILRTGTRSRMSSRTVLDGALTTAYEARARLQDAAHLLIATLDRSARHAGAIPAAALPRVWRCVRTDALICVGFADGGPAHRQPATSEPSARAGFSAPGMRGFSDPP